VGLDDGLVEVATAHILLGIFTDGSGRTVADAANATGIHVAGVSRMFPLALLAPKITDAILHGRQPVELTARSLMRDELPALWSDQHRQLGM
jgi:site-specific DNA recombinase